MLTSGQKDYLDKLPPERANRAMRLQKFDPRTQVIAAHVRGKIRSVLPAADIRFMGASALGIGGQNDVDIYVLCSAGQIEEYGKALEQVFGAREKKKWNWIEEGLEVSVYINDFNDPKQKEQIDIFDKLHSDPGLLQEYAQLKESIDGKTYREYQTAKYEFYNRVLGLH